MLNDNENELVSAIVSFLNEETTLGLPKDDNENGERGYQYLHSQIHDMFMVKSAELTHATTINAAFAKVHGYKYIDDQTFCNALDKELTSQGIPANEREKACKFVQSIIDELKEEGNEWAEKDSGFNPNLDEITDVGKPHTGWDENLKNIDTEFDMSSNVEYEDGDASPGKAYET